MSKSAKAQVAKGGTVDNLRAFGVGVVICIVGTAGATGPEANVWFAVDGVAVVDGPVVGTTLGNGSEQYATSWAGPGNSWTLTCSVASDHSADPVANLIGWVTFQNNSAAPMNFEWAIDVPLCPGVHGASLVGGSASMTLTTVDAGSVSCYQEVPMLRAMANDTEVGLMFTCPGSMGTSGSGNMTSTASFGTPIPSAPGPELITVIGQREQFTLTPGDKVKMQFNFVFQDVAIGDVPTCGADLNGDGHINGMDLSLMLFHWGETPECAGGIAADVDADGVVNGADLALLLNTWGPCVP